MMTQNALILIDIQNDYFPDGKWVVEDIQKAAQNASQLLTQFRQNGGLIVHVRHEIPGETPPFFKAGSTGAEINSVVAPIEGEVVLTKNYPNSFRNTQLKKILDENGIQNVFICGAMSQMCIDGTTRASADFGFNTIVASDACAGKELSFEDISLSPQQVHAAFMAALTSYAKIQTTDQVIENI